MFDGQERVAEFLDRHDMRSDPAYHVLDLAAEVGEIAGDATKSTGFGERPGDLTVARDELGDACYALCAVAESLDVDLEDALEEALAKYERRIEETGDATSRDA